MKNILITGGSGFIGSHFVRLMVNRYPNYSIVNLDKLTYAGNFNNNADILNKSNYHFLKGDIVDQDLIKYLFEKYQFDYVVNFAAETHVDRSILDASEFIKTNIIGTHNLLNSYFFYFSKGLLSKSSKFLQVSTDEVYGSLEKNDPPFTELNSIKPNSPYSASKASADHLVNSYFHTHNLPINVTRCSNNYGPFQFPEKLIPLVISRAINNQSIPVYGDGLQIRDWLYVNDHCLAVEKVLFEGDIGATYNIGGNNEITNIQLIKTILDYLNKPHGLISYVKDRPGHDRRYAINNTKIANKLNWQPQYKFSQAIKETIDWYIINKKWLDSILNNEYLDYYEKNYNK
jgi:dTDP-glucose 4,6-dehydratase